MDQPLRHPERLPIVGDELKQTLLKGLSPEAPCIHAAATGADE